MREFTIGVIPLAIVALMMDGFLFYIFGDALKDHDLQSGLFGMGLLISALIVHYLVLSVLLNTTTITVTHHNLSVKIGPIPPGGASLKDEPIKALYLKQRFSPGAYGSSSVGYVLRALTFAGNDKKLVALASDQSILYIEQTIERFLNIVHQPVSGEYIL